MICGISDSNNKIATDLGSKSTTEKKFVIVVISATDPNLIVHSHLEYCSTLWDPCTENNIS